MKRRKKCDEHALTGIIAAFVCVFVLPLDAAAQSSSGVVRPFTNAAQQSTVAQSRPFQLATAFDQYSAPLDSGHQKAGSSVYTAEHYNAAARVMSNFIRQDDIAAAIPDDGQDVDTRMTSSAGKHTPQAAAADAERARRYQQTVAAGKTAFNTHCTRCHEAARSLEKQKTFAGWKATVRRMARKPEAGIPSKVGDAIAWYLADHHDVSASPTLGAGALSATSGIDAAREQNEPTSAWSFFGTVAPTWQTAISSDGDDVSENPGFHADVWLGVEWQPNRFMSGRVQACTTCHSQGNNQNRLELAEGFLSFNVTEALEQDAEVVQINLDAGRILVPFGAFSTQSHPGAFRTVTRPLMFNMGHNVQRQIIGPSILPMPYADEGINVRVTTPIYCDLDLTWNTYAVNGLQGNDSGINFFQSRDYVDNNQEPAIGTRLALGNSAIKLGASFMVGQHNRIGDLAPADSPVLQYSIFGADLSARCGDFRFQAEYALRTTDSLIFAPTATGVEEQLDGIYVEAGVRVCDDPNIEVVVRYDTLDRHEVQAPGGVLTSLRSHVGRITSGFSINLPGGSVLRLNHEYWMMPAGLDDEQVLAARWVASF